MAIHAAIYARYSSDSQKDISIDDQVKECRKYAEARGWSIVRVYADHAYTGTNDKRPDFQKMIRDSHSHQFEVLIVWKSDRMARSRAVSAKSREVLRSNGVRIESVMEPVGEGASGVLMEAMLDGYAEYYSLNLSENVRRGQDSNAERFLYNGGSVGLGLRINEHQQYDIDPDTAPIVSEIFERFAGGESQKAIIDSLNERGIRTSQGNKFTSNSMGHILKNRRYIGDYIHRGVPTPDIIPPILDKELFELVQHRLQKNSQAPAQAKATESYLLSSKLFCGECGSSMVGESGHGRSQTYYYYKCSNAKKGKGCRKRAVKKDWIEQLVVRLTVEKVLTDKAIKQIAREIEAFQKEDNSVLQLLQKQLAEVDRSIDNIVKAIESGIIARSTQKRLAELEAQQEGLELNITREKLVKQPLTREQIIEWLNGFKDGDISDREYQKQIIDFFINRIYIYDDRIVLTFNASGETRTITLEQVAGSDLAGLPAPKSGKLRRGFAALCFISSAIHAPLK